MSAMHDNPFTLSSPIALYWELGHSIDSWGNIYSCFLIQTLFKFLERKRQKDTNLSPKALVLLKKDSLNTKRKFKLSGGIVEYPKWPLGKIVAVYCSENWERRNSTWNRSSTKRKRWMKYWGWVGWESHRKSKWSIPNDYWSLWVVEIWDMKPGGKFRTRK